MIKKGIKNYFINLKHLFTPLGTLALGFVLGLSVLIPCIFTAVRELAARVAEITGSVNVNFSALFDCIADAVQKLDWSDPMRAVRQIFRAEWLNQTFTDCLHSLLGEGETYIMQIEQAVADSVQQIAAGVVVFIFFIFLGLVGGYWLTKFLVRRTMARRAWWKFFVASLIDSVLSAAMLFAIVIFQSLWAPSVFISFVVSLLLTGFVALMEAYVLHGKGKVSFSAVVNFKNVGKLWLCAFLVFVISVVLSLVALVLLGTLGGLFLTISVLEIAFLVIGMNAESYVKSLAETVNPPENAQQDNGECTETQPAE